jgi:cytochrome P450
MVTPAELVHLLAEIREAGPAVWNGQMQGWMVARYDDAKAVLTDTARFTSEGNVLGPTFGPEAMLVHDGPIHHALRRIWNKPFTIGAAREMRGDFIEKARQNIGPLIARMRAGEIVDVVDGLQDFVSSTIAALMGLPAMREDFKRWNHIITDLPQLELPEDHPKRAVQRAAKAEVYACLNEAMEQRRRAVEAGSPFPDDVISLMMAAEGRDGITRSAVADNLLNLLLGGLDTTVKWMANAVLIFFRWPEVLSALRRDRSLIGPALDEALRLESVVQIILRKSASDSAAVGGVGIPRGDLIYVMPGAAGRDPAAYDDPDRFDPLRKGKFHLGFSFGMHACLGRNIARVEAETLVNYLLDELPAFEIAEIDYGTGWTVWGPRRLMVSLAA